MQPPDAFVLDRRAVRAAFDRASATYDAAAVLQTRVRDELLSRLDLLLAHHAGNLRCCGVHQRR